RVDPCAPCGGRGRIRLQGPMLPVALERTCPACRGAGRIPTRPCVDCNGRGVSRSERTLEVSFPPGVEAGATKRVEGAGNRTRPDRPPGDLELVVEVATHPFFTRDGDDLVCSLPVPFTLAALGGEVEVRTLEGKVQLRVPPGTQPGTVLRLRGKGVPHRFRSGTGDQLVEIGVEVPRDLSPRARELVEHLARELGEDVPTESRGLLERLKGLFE
ncbi:MAG: J domain-containing protein, partial [Deltaproteobacteria bacterium]|nr:J domain-containing protein [Deltaproteobacteria bacterium]